MAQGQRQYECIVFGATGYTGKYTCENITKNLPTDFKWAVAGRSEGRLQNLVDDLNALNPNRTPPAVETARLEKSDLSALAKKTKVLITTVGPYHRYGRIAFEACAEAGTHYLDATGEAPWVYDMIQQYESKAKESGAIMIPQCGVESAAADLMVWMLATHVRRTMGASSGEIVNTLYDVKFAPSGGTLSTVLTLFESYGIGELMEKTKPWAICPVDPPKDVFRRPLMETLTGLRTVSGLGLLTDSFWGETDRTLVQRSWGLHDAGKLYGPKFRLSSYMKARNWLQGFVNHFALTFLLPLLIFPPVRWMLKKFVYQPGEGASKEESKNDFIEWRTIAYVDGTDQSDPKRVYGRMRWNSSLYDLTGAFLAEAALALSRRQTLAHQMGGGILTPSTLGEAYLEGLKKADLQMEVKVLP